MNKEVKQIENIVLIVGTILGALVASMVTPTFLGGSNFFICLISGGILGYFGVYMRNTLIEGVIISAFVLMMTLLFLKMAILPFLFKQIILASAIGLSMGKVIYGMFDEFMDT